MPTFSWEGGTRALRSQARFAQGTATEGSASRRTPEVTDPSQAQDDIGLSSTRTVDGAASARSTSRNRCVLESYVAVSIEPPAAVAEGGLGANPKSVTVSSPAANSTLARTAPSSETSLMRLRPSDANSRAAARTAMPDGPSGAAM